MSVQAETVGGNIGVVSASLSAVVKGKTGDDSWTEVARVMSVSSSGAGFYLKRECPVGGLVSLMLPLSPHQRSYDYDKELYPVWGLVQHCHVLSADEVTGYHVGVAFIGKHPPESYRKNPTQNYRICGMNENGLWKVKETRAAFKTRQHMRYWKSIDLYLMLVDSKRAKVVGEKSVTENISKSGSSVISNLDVNVGDRVKFISEKYDFSGLAVVCNRQIGDDRRPRLHLEFVENTFPINLINMHEAEVLER